MTNSITVVPL